MSDSVEEGGEGAGEAPAEGVGASVAAAEQGGGTEAGGEGGPELLSSESVHSNIRLDAGSGRVPDRVSLSVELEIEAGGGWLVGVVDCVAERNAVHGQTDFSFFFCKFLN